MPKELELLAAVAGWSDVEATPGTEKKLRRFQMVAYTGAPMTVRGWSYPVVLDLAGLQVSAHPRPILKDHSLAQVVGHTDAIRVEAGALKVTGVISGAGPAAREVILSSENGFPWQASVGARVAQEEFVPEGQTAQVNGRACAGPVLIARNAVLGEISFVALGADDHTSARLAANRAAAQAKDPWLDFDPWVVAQGFVPADLTEVQRKQLQALFQLGRSAANAQTAPAAGPATEVQALRAQYAGELQRIAAIRGLCGEAHTALATKAIAEGWDLQRAELEFLRASRPSVPGVTVLGAETPSGEILEAAVCLAGGLDGLARQYPERILDAAQRRFRRQVGLQELFLEAAWANGYAGRSFRNDMKGVLEAAFSTFALPGILSNVANKFLLEGFESVESSWREIAARRNVSDFKQVTSYRLTGGFEYEEVGPDGELKHAQLGEQAYANRAKTYGKMFALTRQDLINDDLGAITAVPRRLGRGAVLKLNEVFWRTFLDSAAFFSAANHNFLDGADTVLGIDGLTKAEQLFLDQTDPDGNPVAVSPVILLVPNALYVAATQLMQSTELREDGNAAARKYPVHNPHAGKFRVVRSSYLSNLRFPGASAKAWHLLSDPNDLPVIEVCFLNGQETPVVESADVDFNMLGIQMRGYHDFGVALQEPRGGVRMKGEA